MGVSQAPGSVLGESDPQRPVAASEDQGEGKLVRGSQGGAKPGTRVSHRVVGGLVAWCRNEGHLERPGWWLLQ